MDSFKFSMQSILDISLNEENEAKNVYETLVYNLNNLKNSLKDLNTTIALNSSISNVEDVSVLHLKRNYLNSLLLQKDSLLKDISSKKVDLENAQKVYIEKQIDRQLIESLRDKELKEYTLKVESEEQARNDEFAIYSYVKKQNLKG